jgi:molybdopterin converting factor small subunit
MKMKVKVKLFGAFRQYAQDVVELDVAEGASLTQLRGALALRLGELSGNFTDTGLLDESVFATDQHILGEATRLSAPTTLAVLPPVCGG